MFGKQGASRSYMQSDEYTALRQEIVTHFQISNQYVLSTLVVTAAIFAFSRNFSSHWFFLIPLVVIVPNGLNYAFRTESILRIGTYIQVFGGELTQQYMWESRLDNLTPRLGWWRFDSLFGRFTYSCSFFGLGLVALIAFLVNSPKSLPSLVGGAVALAMLLAMEYRIITVPKRRRQYLILWREMAKDAQQSPGAYSSKAADGLD